MEPPGTYTTLYEPSWILLGVPCPQYLKSIAALMCSYPRFHTIHQALMRIADRFEQRGRFNVQNFLVASKLLFIFASKIKRNKLQRSSKHREKNAQPSCFQSLEISWDCSLGKENDWKVLWTHWFCGQISKEAVEINGRALGHRQFLRLKQHSPPLLSYISSVLQKPPSPPIFYTFDIVSCHSDYCNKWT